MYQNYEGPLLFNRHVRPTTPEMNPGFTDFVLPVEEEGYVEDLTFAQMKALILDPSSAPELTKNMLMYHHDACDFLPPHMPQFQTASHLPPIVLIFIKWLLQKKVKVEMEERALLQNLGPWLDPAPLLPH